MKLSIHWRRGKVEVLLCMTEGARGALDRIKKDLIPHPYILMTPSRGLIVGSTDPLKDVERHAI